jgi:Zn-dependent peptidase ImmA (M78 family)/transcriptional regulator with XRE-family HTH domain
MNINPRQLTFAREYRGYSQTELSSHIEGLSQSNLSKYEKGIGNLSDEVLLRIFSFLGFPEAFFERTISNNVENAHYRKKAGVLKKDRDQIEKSNKLIGYIIDQMSDSIEFPDFDLKVLDLEDGYTPASAADFTRRFMGIRQGAVKDVCTILESHGIIIVEYPYDVEGFDGVSFLTDKGFPVMVINRNFSNDRKRLTIAHELGHIIMHISPTIAIPDYRNNEKEKEKEANQFAAEFLMPAVEIQNSLRGLKLSSLISLKGFWLTSMASIIRRAWDLKCIDQKWYTYLNIELSRKGYKKHEPLNVYLDSPRNFQAANRLFHEDLGYNNVDMANAFSLPTDVIQDICSNKPILRIYPKR